jgi:hypothetical protein
MMAPAHRAQARSNPVGRLGVVAAYCYPYYLLAPTPAVVPCVDHGRPSAAFTRQVNGPIPTLTNAPPRTHRPPRGTNTGCPPTHTRAHTSTLTVSTLNRQRGVTRAVVVLVVAVAVVVFGSRRARDARGVGVVGGCLVGTYNKGQQGVCVRVCAHVCVCVHACVCVGVCGCVCAIIAMAVACSPTGGVKVGWERVLG